MSEEKKKPLLRFIGDVHGHYEPYVQLASGAEYSICVGDVGFHYHNINALDPEKHRIVGGNHDNYDNLSKHFLGDFGVHTVPGFGNLFYVRGAWSIDHEHRTPGRDWWWQEELSNAQMEAALKAYMEIKPDFVVTHDCPLSIIALMNLRPLGPDFDLGPQRTPRLLDMMWNFHKPKTWIYGHFHKEWKEHVTGTDFHCLHIMSIVDYDENRQVVGRGQLG